MSAPVSERHPRHDRVPESGGTWLPVCPLQRLETERGVAALLENGDQVALFRLYDGRVRAVHNRDPFTGAYVMSRGIVGTRQGQDVVSSPMHKQGFDLETGRCLDDEATTLQVFAVRVRHGVVEVRQEPARA